MRLGGPVFCDSDDPQELVRAHQRSGYSAAYCPPAVFADRNLIAPMRRAFQTANIVIAEVPAWSNLLDPDETKRKQAFELTCERLALADELGAVCCVNTLGSRHPSIFWGPHPDNYSEQTFEASVVTAQAILDAVKPKRAKLAFEMSYNTWLDSPDNCLKVLEAIDRPAVAAHLDPVNLVYAPRIYWNTTDLIERCIALLGPYIVSCHAKDIRMIVPASALQFEEVMLGTGVLDYETFLTGISSLHPGIPLMLEHLPGPDEYAQAADYIRSVASVLGLEVTDKHDLEPV